MENKMSAIQSAMSFDPVAYARQKAEFYNRETGVLEGYDCPQCRNRGNFARVREDGSLYFQDCTCVNIRNCVKKMAQSGLKDVIRDYTFEKYQDTEPWQKAIKQGAMDYAGKGTGWLLLCGQSGCGKTHLSVAVCRKLLMEGREVVYMPWRECMRALKGLEFEEQMAALRGYQNAPVLYVDDLFKTGRAADSAGSLTATDVNLTFELLNFRYTKRLPTVISTERMPGELLKIDEALGGRIVELAREHTYCVTPKAGRNYRLRSVVNL